MSKQLELASLRLQGKILKIASQGETQLKKDLVDATLAVHSAAVRSIYKISNGEKETRYRPKRTVTVSKPGDPPNSDTGRLAQSIEFEVDDMTSVVGTNLKYGAFLEFGTKDVHERPWLLPAFLKNKKKITEIVFKGAKLVLDKAAK